MSETKRNIIVGATAIAATLCLLTMLLLFGWVPQMLDRGYSVRVNLPDAGGLYEGARVWYGGVEVGTVAAVDRREALRPEVVVTVKVQADNDLPEGLSAYVYEPLIGGAPRLMLDLIAADVPLATMPRDGSAQIEGRYISRIGAMVGGTGGEKLDDALAQAGGVLASVQDLAGTWGTLGEQLVVITAARSPASVDAGEAEGNLYSLLARADTRVAELKTVIADAQRVMDQVDRLVGDPKVQADFKNTLGNAAALTSTMARAVPRLESKIDGTLTSIDGRVGDALGTLTKEYSAVAQRLTESLEAYRLLAEEVRAGQGTAGKLVQDPALYNNLNDAVERLQTAIETFRTTLETWTKDGLPLKL